MNRIPHDIIHKWHVALNAANFAGDMSLFRFWMYEAKALADEVPRLTYLFGQEREGKLPNSHRQCSHSAPEPIQDNHLSCCLGVACRDCEHLKAIEASELPPEWIDQVKAWTCCAHILTECGAHPGQYDTSEGFVKTVSDTMYWQNVYQSLANADRDGV